MATIESGLFRFAASHSNNDISSQFSNLNLNNVQKFSLDDGSTFSSFSKSNKNKFSVNNYGEKEKLWDKSTKDSSLKALKIPSLHFEAKETKDIRKNWIGDKQDASLNTKSSSTLSLHIAAYENSLEVGLNEIKDLPKKSNSVEFLPPKSQINQDLFEFPRQMEENESFSTPEVQQFTASQRLLSPNQSTPVRRARSSGHIHFGELFMPATMPLRRSARLAAIQERRRESEEDALRQQRERIAQTHRHVSRHGHGSGPSVSMRMPTPPPSLRLTRPRVRTPYGLEEASRTNARGRSSSNINERPRLVRQYAIRRRHNHEVMANPQLTNRGTNTNISARHSSSGRFPNRPMRAGGALRAGGSTTIATSHNLNRPLFIYDTPELRESVFNIGLILGNRYSSDSEDSYFQPRVIDPDEISEDQSDEETTPPPETAAPLVQRRVTRSMSTRAAEVQSSSVSCRPATSQKKIVKGSTCKCKAGTSAVRAVIKVEKISPCTICYEDEPKKPVACTYCRQIVGCRHCVKKWFMTTNMSHLDQRTPYPMSGTDRNHKRCPLCRQDVNCYCEFCKVVT